MSDNVILELDLDQVIADPNNVRRRMDLTSLRELAASIKSAGQLQPGSVQANGDGKYHVVSGHRRLAALILLAEEGVPNVKFRAEVVTPESEMEVRRAQLIENIQRQDLDPVDEALGYKELAAAGLKVKDIGAMVGKAQSHISKRMALLKLSETVHRAIRDGYLGLDDAYQLSKFAHYEAEVDALVTRYTDEKRPVPSDVIERLGEKLEFAERRIALIKNLEDRGVMVQDPSTIDTKILERLEVIPADELPEASFNEDDVVTVELPSYGHPKITRWGPRVGKTKGSEGTDKEEQAREARRVEKEAKLDRLQQAQLACRRPSKSDVASLAFVALAHNSAYGADAKDVVNILVLEPKTRVEKRPDRDGNQVEKDVPDWHGTLHDVLRNEEIPVHRVALAHLLAPWVRDGSPAGRMRDHMPLAAAIGDWMADRTQAEG